MKNILYILLTSLIFFSISCNKDTYFMGKIEIEDIDTLYITAQSALCKGNVIIESFADGSNAEIIETGILCSIDSIFIANIIQSEYHNNNDSIFKSSHVGKGNFSCVLNNLKSSTKYYVRAYALVKRQYSNNKNITYKIYGNMKFFKTSMSDSDNNAILLTPRNFTATQNNYNIILNWNEGINNTGKNVWYYIEKRDSENAAYSNLHQTPLSTSYIDNNPIEGINYYRIFAYWGYSDDMKSNYAYAQCDFKPTGTTEQIAAPIITSVIKENNHIMITWNKVDNAVEYFIFRSNNSNNFGTEPFARVGDVDYFIDNTPNNGTNCYKIKAYNVYMSDFSNTECVEF